MPRPSLPRAPIAVLAGLVGLEGLGLAVIAAFYVLELAGATTADGARGGVTALLALVTGAALLVVARALLGARRWARSPALVTNLILLPVAVGLVQGGRWYVGAPLLAWAATVVVLLFSRAVTDALDETDAGGAR